MATADSSSGDLMVSVPTLASGRKFTEVVKDQVITLRVFDAPAPAAVFNMRKTAVDLAFPKW
jgi:hypothetical protein